MAIPKIKGTYSLDAETVGALERVARRWGVSKSEALRRAIHASDASVATPATATGDNEANPRLAAFRRLQQIMNFDAAAADAWIAELRAEREASSERIHRRWEAAEGAADRRAC